MRLLSADSPVRLPWTTLRLAGRYLLPLAAWFALGQALHWLIIWVGVMVGHGGLHQLRVALVLSLLVVLAMITVTVPILMLHSLRGGVTAAQDKTEVDGLATVISRSMLPFVIIYFAWGMIKDDASAFSRRDIEQNWTQFYTSLHPEAGMIFFGLGFGVSFAIAVGCYYIRAACEMLANRRDNRAFPIVAAFFETGFNVFGLFSIVKVVSSGSTWLTERHIWSVLGDFFTSVGNAIPGWDAFWGMIADAWPNFTDAVILPLLWLTLASVVYGRELFDERETARGTRLERLYERYDSLSSFQRWTLDHVLTSFRERWAPITGAVRLAMRAGGPAVGVFCLCYVAIDVLTALGARGVVDLIGFQNDIAVWGPITVPITFVRDLLRMVLQISLLAGMFDLAVRHEKRRLAAMAEVSAGTPEPDRSPLASGYRTDSPAPASAAPPHARG